MNDEARFERVERVAAAIAKVSAAMQGDVLATWADHTPEDQWAFQEMARAAIAAMDAEPTETLEDVLRDAGVYNIEIDVAGGDGWDAMVVGGAIGNGTGPTIDAAIRSAIAAAEGSE